MTTRVYTAWHPVLVVLLTHVLPRDGFHCLSEPQLAREPLRIDVVIVQKTREGTPPVPRLLESILDDLPHDTLVHFKGPSDELERDDARMRLAYAALYLVVAAIDDPVDVALRVVAPRMIPRFLEALRSLGCELVVKETGVQEGLISDDYFCRLATTRFAGRSAVRTACAIVGS